MLADFHHVSMNVSVNFSIFLSNELSAKRSQGVFAKKLKIGIYLNDFIIDIVC